MSSLQEAIEKSAVPSAMVACKTCHGNESAACKACGGTGVERKTVKQADRVHVKK